LYLSPPGRHAEAIDELKRAQELDPLSLIVKTDLGFAYFFAGQYDAAFSQYQEVLAANPSFAPAYWALDQYYFEREIYGPAVAELAQVLSHNGIRKWRGRPGPPMSQAMATIAEGALGALEQSFRAHEPNRIRLKGEPPGIACAPNPNSRTLSGASDSSKDGRSVGAVEIQ
jgi:tetratricopeptide (TPR) repeat protein